MVQHLHAILALGTESCLGAGFQGLVGRIATRYEKTDTCFAAMINIVAVVLWTR